MSRPRRPTLHSSVAAPATWAAVLTLVTAACGGATDSQSSSGASGGNTSGGTTSGTTSGSPGGAGTPCSTIGVSCANQSYYELPDGGIVPDVTEGGAPEGGVKKFCYCGNG